MSTRSCIAALCDDGKIRAINCHYDGYPDGGGVGGVLERSFNDQYKIEDLLKLGALSCLHHSIDCPPGHSYATPVESYTVAYHRDRGEDLEVGEEYDFEERDPKDVLRKLRETGDWQYVDFLYYWNGTKWYYICNYDCEHTNLPGKGTN